MLARSQFGRSEISGAILTRSIQKTDVNGVPAFQQICGALDFSLKQECGKHDAEQGQCGHNHHDRAGNFDRQ